MAKHFDEDGDGVADQPRGRPDDGDFDLGVPSVTGQYFHRLEQARGLGRHVLHDTRSLEYDAADLVAQVTTERTTYHQRYGEIFDQGDVGACTGMAALGLMNTEPFVGSKLFTTEDALAFYSRETVLDDRQIPGRYPPEDTGSTGLWSMKQLRADGLIPGYRWAFSLATVKRLLQVSPVSLGIPWFNSMFASVDRHGFLSVNAESGLAGGHQIEATGVDFERQAVEITNIWGEGWGVRGRAYVRFSDLEQLLKLHGDVSVPTGRS